MPFNILFNFKVALLNPFKSLNNILFMCSIWVPILEFLCTCTFVKTFSGLFRNTCTSCYTFSERLKFIVFKIDKTASKFLNEEEHGQYKNKELLKSYAAPVINIFWKKFSMDESYYYLTRFCQKKCNSLLNKKCPKRLILGICYFPIPR